MEDIFVLLCWVISFFIQKNCWHALITCQQVGDVCIVWMAHTSSYGDKSTLPSCYWKRHYVIFLLVWHMTTDDGRFVADDHFPLYFLSPIKKYMFVLFVFCISISVFIQVGRRIVLVSLPQLAVICLLKIKKEIIIFNSRK